MTDQQLREIEERHAGIDVGDWGWDSWNKAERERVLSSIRQALAGEE